MKTLPLLLADGHFGSAGGWLPRTGANRSAPQSHF